MGRTRMLPPELFTDERVAALAREDRYAFVGLLCEADREGRMRDQPRRLKLAVEPWDEDTDFDDVLTRIAAAGLIARYERDGERFIAIPEFLTTWKQKPHVREAKSDLPPPPRGTPKASQGTPEADLGAPSTIGPSSVSEENPAQDQPRSAQGTPRRPDPDPKSKSDPDPDSRDRTTKRGGASELVKFLRHAWPRQIPDPEKAEAAWRKAWPDLELFDEAKAAKAHEAATGNRHDNPGAFLHSWFKKAAAERKVGNGASTTHTPGGGNGEEIARAFRANAEESMRRVREDDDEYKKAEREGRTRIPPDVKAKLDKLKRGVGKDA